MSMQINVDPAGLTQAQREAVAGFILAYPANAVGDQGHVVAEIHDSTEAVTLRVPAPVAVAVAANPVGASAHLADEITHLAKDGGEFDASVAFGGVHAASAIPSHDLQASEAFGSAPAPLPPGATGAPFIADAAPFLTAPAAMPATTSTAPMTAPAPPAPNSVSAAAIAAPPTGSPAGGVDLDKFGLPWDGRIHAGTKRKNADASWTAKRGVDPALVAQVEAELRAVMGAPLAQAAPAAHTPAQQVATVTMPTAGVASSAVAVPAPPSSAPAAQVAHVPPAPSADARQQFVGLVGRASAAIQAGKVTQAEVTQCCVHAGVPALPLLANRLDLVPQVAAHVDALIAARQ